MTKAVITVIGKDTVGIIAGICTYLAEKKVNILRYFPDNRTGILQYDDDC